MAERLMPVKRTLYKRMGYAHSVLEHPFEEVKACHHNSICGWLQLAIWAQPTCIFSSVIWGHTSLA